MLLLVGECVNSTEARTYHRGGRCAYGVLESAPVMFGVVMAFMIDSHAQSHARPHPQEGRRFSHILRPTRGADALAGT